MARRITVRQPALTMIFSFSLFILISCTGQHESFKRRTLSSIPDSIPYFTGYGGHLQGITTDYRKFLFWSHTVHLVKTDLNGKVLKKIDVPTHYGDPEWYMNKLYVAVNFGMFNEEPGLSDSWIYVYDPDNLDFICRYPVPEVVHGAGGIGIHDGRVFVVGGLPDLPGYDMNLVYEYDIDFKLQRVHKLASGHTRKGIQTAAWSDGYWYFGCYASEQNPYGKVIKAVMSPDGNLTLVEMFDTDMSYGIIGLEGDQFLCSGKGFNFKAAKQKLTNKPKDKK